VLKMLMLKISARARAAEAQALASWLHEMTGLLKSVLETK
jgi:hypothetical protein